jgi:hypothetical protein
MPPRDPFARRLPSQIAVKNGPALVTVADARAYVLSLPPHRAEGAQWQRAVALMIDGADTEAIWGALKLALLYDATLDVRRTQ